MQSLKISQLRAMKSTAKSDIGIEHQIEVESFQIRPTPLADTLCQCFHVCSSAFSGTGLKLRTGFHAHVHTQFTQLRAVASSLEHGGQVIIIVCLQSSEIRSIEVRKVITHCLAEEFKLNKSRHQQWCLGCASKM